jgi:hypothetical protein
MKSSLWICQLEAFRRDNIYLLVKVVVVVRRCIRATTNVPGSVQGGLGLRRLGLLSALLGSLLLLHLLVAQGGQTRSDLLDLIAGQILCDTLAELLQEQRVLPLLRVVGKEGDQGLAQLEELVLGVGVEKRHGAEVDRIGGVARIGDGDGLCSLGLANREFAEQLLSLSTRGFLLGQSQPLALLFLSFVLIIVILLLLSPAQSRLSVLLDALCL